ncbi:MAG: helix-turn-helix domain-containing protein [Verrucomicrobia bacterium]|nr:helix-turn-helix domain-containing protein [Verrucomicrobiota bacterium]MCH8512553.1 helix-turn-helix domain-containing protein [Kiritimatiellia bacterium]
MSTSSLIYFDADPMNPWVADIYRAFSLSEEMAEMDIRLTTYHGHALAHPDDVFLPTRAAPAGVITDYEPRWRRCLHANIPCVLLNQVLPRDCRAGERVVRSDYLKMGEQAAEVLLARGVANLAFLGCGNRGNPTMELKRKGFERKIGEGEGTLVEIPSFAHDQRWLTPQAVDQLAAWFRTAPKSLAVAAVNIYFAWGAWKALKLAGRRLPEEVLLLAVGDDPVLLEMASPSVSGIPENSTEIGRVCARDLRALIDGERTPCETLIAPLRVVHRDSTARVFSEDPVVARALAYMRDTLAENPSMDEIARHAFVSRATLLRRFREHRGRTPSAELAQLRVEHAIDLILHTDQSFAAIADAAGYGLQSALSRAIRQATGKTPTELRRR